ncbi:unnamed protein product [Effrenium voratum]|nr:unnamed protein product [Effrenium voratum]
MGNVFWIALRKVRCDLESSERCKDTLESCMWTSIKKAMPVDFVHDGTDLGELELCGPHCVQLSKLLRSTTIGAMEDLVRGSKECRCRIFILASEYCRVNIENCQFGLELLEEELPRWEDSNVHTAALNWQLAKLKMMIATSQKQFPQHRRAALECAKTFSDSEKDTHFGVLVCAYADMLCKWCYEGDKVNADDAASEVQGFLGTIPKCFTGRALYALGTWHEKCHGRFYEAAKLFKDGFQGEVSFSSKSSQREALLFLSAMVSKILLPPTR